MRQQRNFERSPLANSGAQGLNAKLAIASLGHLNVPLRA